MSGDNISNDVETKKLDLKKPAKELKAKWHFFK